VPALRWLPEALEDVERLHSFLAEISPGAARRAAAAILAGADHLAEHPRIGRPLGDGRREWFAPFGVGAYVLRYRLDENGNPVVVRVWHSREQRGGSG
jgi:plasmid stabilization system protein ParE